MFKLKVIIAVEIGQITCILLKQNLHTLLNINRKHINKSTSLHGIVRNIIQHLTTKRRATINVV